MAERAFDVRIRDYRLGEGGGEEVGVEEELEFRVRGRLSVSRSPTSGLGSLLAHSGLERE
jgi:hypothetical protein